MVRVEGPLVDALMETSALSPWQYGRSRGVFSKPNICAAFLVCLGVWLCGSAQAQTSIDVRAIQQSAWVDVTVQAKSSEHQLSRRNVIFPKFEPQWRRGRLSERQSMGGSSFSISIGSGRAPTVSQSGEYSYTVQMRLHPQQAGELTLGAFQLQVSGQ